MIDQLTEIRKQVIKSDPVVRSKVEFNKYELTV